MKKIKVKKLGLARTKNRLLYCKGTAVMSVPRGRKGPKTRVATFKGPRVKNCLYFVDHQGDVSRCKMKRRGR